MNTVKPKKAYSYQRFSSTKQRDGDSLRRQTIATDTFCRHFGLTLLDTFRDEGVSAFKGKNFSDEAALSQFLRLVEGGTIEKGSVLVVESLDRISRQDIWPCFNKFQEILKAGIGIGVLSLNKIFDYEGIKNNPMELMLVLVEFSRANNESEIKSKRSKSSVASRIERMKKGEKFIVIGKPYWIAGVKDGQFVIDEDKATLVKEIYSRYLAGRSATKIASELNQEEVPTLSGVKRFVWATMTILQILRNKNVIGTTAINDVVIENYYPVIISPKVFQLVQQKLSFNKANRGGSKSGYVNNLFKGLMRCSKCGKNIEVKIAWYRDVKGVDKRYYTYTCSGVHQHTKCTNKGRIVVSRIEQEIFFRVLNLNDYLNPPVKETNDIVSGLENKLARIQIGMSNLIKMAAGGLDDVSDIQVELKTLKAQKIELEKELETEKGKLVVADNGIRTLEVLKSQFITKGEKLAKTIPEAVKLIMERVKAGQPKKVDMFKDTVRELIENRLNDLNYRYEIRNAMPSIFREIKITFGDTVKADMEFVNGKKQTLLINKK